MADATPRTTRHGRRGATGDAVLRTQLVAQLRGGQAHVTFETAIRGLPPALRGEVPRGVPYSPWMLLEHIRIAQFDILEFTRNPEYLSPPWPVGYWPDGPSPPAARAWTRSVARYLADRGALERLARDRSVDLCARIPHGTGQTVLREILLAATHASYHIAELVVVRRLLGAWGR